MASGAPYPPHDLEARDPEDAGDSKEDAPAAGPKTVDTTKEVARGCLGQLIDRIHRYALQTAIAVLLCFAIGAPWLVKATIWADPSAIAWVESDDVPRPSREAFGRLRAALEPLGFETIGWLRADTAPGSVTFVGLLAHAEERHWGTILATYTPIPTADGGVELDHSMSAIEFVTPLADGGRLSTSNIHWPKSFASHDGATETRHPTIEDPIALRRRHLAERREAGVEAIPLGDDRDAMLDIARQQFLREMDAQVAAGLFAFDADEQRYRPTWKGAFVMTYRQLFDVLLGDDNDDDRTDGRPTES